MTMLPMKTETGMMSGGGGMTQQQMGLLGLGAGILSANPRTAGLASGVQAYGRAMDPNIAMQRQMMQAQLAELERKRKADEAYYAMISGGGQPAAMVDQPALGPSLVDVPGGGVEPGQVQTAYRMENLPVTPDTPPVIRQNLPASPGMVMRAPAEPAGGFTLPEGVTPEFMQMLGPERGRAFLAQMYKPMAAADRKTAKDVAGRLRYLDTGELAFPGVTPPVEAPEGPKPGDVAGMRKEFSGQSKDYRSVRTAFSKVQETAKNPSAAGDLALIFNYMKMLDPGSVVREGEFATAQSAAGVPTQVRNVYNRLVSGERLAPEQRQDFLNQAYNVYSAQASGQNLLEEQYRDLAARSGYDPENVVIDYQGKLRDMTPLGQAQTEAAAPSAPAQVSSQAEYDKLPSGTQYMAPDGKIRIKK